MVIGWFLMGVETGIAILVEQKHFLIYISFLCLGPKSRRMEIAFIRLLPRAFFTGLTGIFLQQPKKEPRGDQSKRATRYMCKEF